MMQTTTDAVTTHPPQQKHKEVERPMPLVSSRHHHPMITGLRMYILEFWIRMTIARVAIGRYRNPMTSISILNALDALRRRILGPHRIKKLTRVDGKYYWDLYTPGWPSPIFDRYFSGEMHRIVPQHATPNRFTNILMAITKKCPLKCEHCFEWNALNGKERLTLSDIQKMVSTFQNMGTGQIQLTGGEPMLRVDDITEVVRTSADRSDFWILTSGFNLTDENAKALKKAGLTGVVISLDHFESDKHDQFRGFPGSFNWVQNGVQHAQKNNLVTALSLCATRDFTTEANLRSYADLAKEMGVSFIQILEPRAVGHYQGRDVALGSEHEQILENFYFDMNYDPAFSTYPIVSYHGFHQRNIGCFSSGNRNLYIDTDGDMHACPFCQTKTGSALADDLEETIDHMQSRGCHSYKSFTK